MESEVELDEEIKKLHAIAANPALYPDLVALKGKMPYYLLLFEHILCV